MESKEAETLLYQIMSGHVVVRVEGKTYQVHSPTISQKRRAAEIAQEAYEDTAYDMWTTDFVNKRLLISLGQISKEIDENFKEIETRIEDLKVELFESAFDSKKKDKIRTILGKVKSKVAEMHMSRHQYDAMTREGYAEIIKMQALVAMTMKDEQGRPVFAEEEIFDANFSLLDKIIRILNSRRIDEGQIRFLSRMESWRGYWSLGKASGNPFGKPSVELTDDQRLLCQMSRMYDSAYEHPDCPDEDILNDDDAFDGWMIKERRKGEKDKNQRMVDDITGGKHESANELFVVAGSQKDAKKINSLNDMPNQMIKKQREAAIKAAGGKLHDAALPDQQIRIRTEAAQLLSQNVKSSKG